MQHGKTGQSTELGQYFCGTPQPLSNILCCDIAQRSNSEQHCSAPSMQAFTDCMHESAYWGMNHGLKEGKACQARSVLVPPGSDESISSSPGHC